MKFFTFDDKAYIFDLFFNVAEKYFITDAILFCFDGPFPCYKKMVSIPLLGT